MAQSFNAITTSLGEAERQKNGKSWTESDFKMHQEKYNIDPSLTKLNHVLISVNDRSERDVVNDFMMEKIQELNQEKIDKVAKWNEDHTEIDPETGLKIMKTNPKTGKQYHKKSVDKRELFPVGDYKGKGKRSMPYDTFKNSIERGNARGKENAGARMRTGVLQQFMVGIGNEDEWVNDKGRQKLIQAIKNNDNLRQQAHATRAFERVYLAPFLNKFKEENSHMHVVQAVVHYDESHPHMQFTVLPHVGGKENGGLGSVGYTSTIKTDHPNYKSGTVGKFYEHQHRLIRNIIEHGVILKDRFGVELKAELGDRPGSHKSTRVDQFAKKKEDLSNQEAWLAKRENTLNVAETPLKNISIETIKSVDLDGGLLDISKTVTQGLHGRKMIGPPKAPKSTRIISIDPETWGNIKSRNGSFGTFRCTDYPGNIHSC